MKLKYQTGEPHEVGVYACRVLGEVGLYENIEDVFLMWIDGKWAYLSSDQYCRKGVVGWLGPLPRWPKPFVEL